MNVDKSIQIIHKLKEDAVVGGMTTGSSGSVAGFSEKSPAEGPTSGITPVIGKMTRRSSYASGGTGSRKKWLDYLNNKINYHLSEEKLKAIELYLAYCKSL